MRLRTRLALAFALLAVVPLALVVPPTIAQVSAVFSKEPESRLNSSADMADLVLADLRRTARSAVEDILTGAALEDFARELRAQEHSPQRLAAAVRLMHSRGLSVLSLLDDKGATLS